jgi:hypothetical protein
MQHQRYRRQFVWVIQAHKKGGLNGGSELRMSIIDIFALYRDTDISAETYRFSMSIRYILNNEKIKDLSFLGVELLNFLL